ncbi:MAG TPA: exodeoxyribonuclease VII small subunit [bacterium]|nr:exodeoxyribonuclease VII small subunit [bacterium]
MEKKGGIAAKFAELDRIAEKLSGGAELEEAMKLYEKGMKLAAEIRDYLAKAEKKIQVIGADGSVTNKEEHELGKESV